MPKQASSAISLLLNWYKKRLGKVNVDITQDANGVEQTIHFHSQVLKKGNHPRIFYHGKTTSDVIILTHGLSDSPYYVKAIGEKFYHAGCNVILTLLPGHGLKNVKDKMEQENLKRKWKKELGNAMEAARHLGKRISLGGFSTGATLSVYKAIRYPKLITGGLFLFSAALDLGYIALGSNYVPFAHTIARYTDEKMKSIGTNPYRYPYLNNAAGIEVVRLIAQIWKLMGDDKIEQPTFIAHSIHDTRVSFAGVHKFMAKHVKKGFTFLLSENIAHSQLVLEKNISLDLSQKHGVRETPIANPKFDWMMDDAIRFFKMEVVGEG
ncbi:MAG TPA: hypothetical protein ENJ53_04840 [Phaeodactylibacter sp.]|nr:hypothetical protein [Phaeodactylibacter sp.]